MSSKKNVANTKTSAKRKPTPASWKPGQSGNPKGAPKRGQSWAEVIRDIGEMTPDEARALSEKIFAEVRLGNEITLKQAVVMRVFAGLLFDPTPGNFRELMDRADGSVKHNVKVESWQDEIIAALNRGEITTDEVVKELGPDDSRGILIAAQQIDLSQRATQSGEEQ